jgi:hypothetical protein
MQSRRKLTTLAAVVIMTTGLVIGIAGPSWGSRSAPRGQVGTAGIKNGAVTKPKIASGAVTTSKIANAAVTASKVRAGSLTASDVAPNTFLSSDGEAANSLQLQGKPADAFVQGIGQMLANSATVVDGNSSPTLFSFGFGKLIANCNISGIPTVTYVSQQDSSAYQLMVTAITAGGTSSVSTSNGLTAGAGYTSPNPSGLPQQVSFQVHYVDNNAVGHYVTAWVTDQEDAPDTECIFFGQAVTAG